jgi:hypothetical protein
MPHNRLSYLRTKILKAVLMVCFWVVAALVVTAGVLGASLLIGPKYLWVILLFLLVQAFLLWRIYFQLQLSLDSARDWWGAYKKETT